jgi:hypothetical protein
VMCRVRSAAQCSAVQCSAVQCRVRRAPGRREPRPARQLIAHCKALVSYILFYTVPLHCTVPTLHCIVCTVHTLCHTLCLHCAYTVPTLCLHCAYTVPTLCLHCAYIAPRPAPGPQSLGQTPEAGKNGQKKRGRHCTEVCRTAPRCTVVCRTAPRCTALCSTALRFTVQNRVRLYQENCLDYRYAVSFRPGQRSDPALIWPLLGKGIPEKLVFLVRAECFVSELEGSHRQDHYTCGVPGAVCWSAGRPTGCRNLRLADASVSAP